MERQRRAKFEFKGIKGLIIFIVLACMLLCYYFYLSNRLNPSKTGEEAEKLTAVQEVLLRNMETDYPPTPKEVIKYYSELTQTFYNEKLTDEQIEQLGARARELYDEELNEYNTDEKYIPNLREDIEDFNQHSIKISSYTLPASTEVEYYTEEGRECARIYCTYHIRQGKDMTYSREIFVLRRAENGRWKILGWDLVKED
ncbi:MAG: hypothetical protein GX234_09810 [Clostridiales bacterium]|nr:hypothetical protein [Clostridiales bacterium]